MPAPLRALSVGLVAASAILGVACSGGDAPAGPEPGGAGARRVTIKGFNFQPASLQASVGDTVTVTNEDDAEHTLTADDGSFDTGRFSSGSRPVTLTKAGSIAYHCVVHDYMKGVIQVSG